MVPCCCLQSQGVLFAFTTTTEGQLRVLAWQANNTAKGEEDNAEVKVTLSSDSKQLKVKMGNAMPSSDNHSHVASPHSDNVSSLLDMPGAHAQEQGRIQYSDDQQQPKHPPSPTIAAAVAAVAGVSCVPIKVEVPDLDDERAAAASAGCGKALSSSSSTAGAASSWHQLWGAGPFQDMLPNAAAGSFLLGEHHSCVSCWPHTSDW